MSIVKSFGDNEIGQVWQPGSVGMKRAVVSATIGNMLEFYDFVTYSFFAIQIGRAFFPVNSDYGSLMLSLATFGVGFITRPIGALVLGIYSDHHGRRPAMLISFALMGTAILVIAVTPSYDAIGVAAPVIVILARLLQGFALGGEVGPSTAYLMEIAPPERRALMIALQPVSQGLASAAGALVGFILSASMTPAGLESLGWRIAFLIGAACLPFGLWMRRTLPETFSQANDAAPPKWWHHFTLARKYLGVIMLALMVLANATIATYVSRYITTYAQSALHVAPSLAFATSLVSTGFHMIGALLGGWMADRASRKPVMIGTQLAMLVLTYPIFMWMVDAPGTWSLLLGFGVLSLIMLVPGIIAGVTLLEALPQQIRGGLLGTIYAVAITVFGGTTQLMVTWLIHVTGNPMAPAWYLLFATAIGLLAMMLMPETAPAKDSR